MLKKILIILQLFASITLFGQKIISTEYYNKGVEYLNNKNYTVADSLFTTSLEYYPSVDAYYNLAASKLKQGDTCSLCHNLKKAALLGDTVSTKYYNIFCSSNTEKEKMMNFYKVSEPIYSAIVKTHPSSNAYFDLALTKAKLGDKCAFCQYLDSTSKRGFEGNIIWNLFKKACCSKEIVQINDSAQNDFKILNIISTSNCTNERKECIFLKINQKNDTIMNFSADIIPKGFVVKIDTMEKAGESKHTFYIDTISKNAELINCNSKKINNIITIHIIMPSFKGGEDAMYEWLGENIKYPQVAKETGVSGTVIVTFVVEKDGSITGIKILKNVGGGCGAEALRVVNAMPKWIPGTQNGNLVRVQYNLPIRFSLVE